MTAITYWIGVDTGGTFTDCVIMDEKGALTYSKAPSTPRDFSIGVINAVEAGAQLMGIRLEHILKQAAIVAHASTTATNVFLTRTGARVGLLTTQGFEDTIFVMRSMGRHAGLSEEDIKRVATARKPEPFVSRRLIKGVKERIDYKGTILVKLDRESTEQMIKELVDDGVEAIVVSLLWSPSNPVHEIEIKKMINERYPSIPVTISSEISPMIGEYERTSTAVISGYVGPSVVEYHSKLSERLQERGFRYRPLIMQGYGGSVSLEESIVNPAGTIQSGPAAGVTGSKFLGELLGYRNIITSDVGGTSFDVGLIVDGEPTVAHEPVIGQFAYRVPIVDVTSIGAAGGSIVWIDPVVNLLKVGPASAGALPGPVCYDTGGTEPTVTDCDLALGYLNPDYFLGGRIKLNKGKAIEAIKNKIADPLGMTVEEAAAGVYSIAGAQMADLIRSLTVKRGYVPGDFVLFAYGGAGPLHAPSYGREAQAIVVPSSGAVHSAMGVLASDFMHEYHLGSPRTIPVDVDWFNGIFEDLENKALEAFQREGFREEEVDIRRIIDMRYALQLNELRTPVPRGRLSSEDLEKVWDEFESLYEKLFGKGSGYRPAGMQVVTFRLEARAKVAKPAPVKLPLQPPDASGAVKMERDIFLPGQKRFVNVNIYDGGKLQPGNIVAGPSIIELPLTTILIDDDQVGRVDEYLNTIIKAKEE
jgi:N-methylhydantoinase A